MCQTRVLPIDYLNARSRYMTTRRRIDAETLLPNCPENRIGVALPGPINDRLDDLVKAVEATGDRTSRKELLACLILAAPNSGQAVANLLRAYRGTSARKARLDGGSDEATVPIRSHRPGPRPRRPD